ncbi:MAG: hypothetical protein NTW19_12715 [Planctomycetota bacterium]|nr:hypothetical protein [Planctomycetota bacterium]
MPGRRAGLKWYYRSSRAKLRRADKRSRAQGQMATAIREEVVAVAAPAPDVGHRAEVASTWCLVVLFFVAYIYFFQGGGWNPNARFDTTRALVERQTFVINHYAANTGDVATIDGRIYANKPPGLSVLSAPIYFVLYRCERQLRIDVDDWRVLSFNSHVLSFWTAGLPALLLVLSMRRFAREEGASVGSSWILAAAFGAGTLLWPYAGMIMSHSIVAYLLFEAWMLVRRRVGPAGEVRPPTARGHLLAGILLGLALTIEYLVAPTILLFFIAAAWGMRTDRQWRPYAWIVVGPVAGGLMLMLFQRLEFGHWFGISYDYESPLFRHKGLLMGVLDWPKLERLYWLSFHPFRGLAYCCPVLALAPLGLIPGATRTARLRLYLLPLAIASTFVLFNLSFNGWTGGCVVGPRYLLPAVPFIYVMVVHAYDACRWICWPVMIASVVIMLAVTAVAAQMPGPNFGPPPSPDLPYANPVVQALQRLWEGRLSVYPFHIITPAEPEAFRRYDRSSPPAQWASYNLGHLLGMPRLWSLLPLSVVAALATAAACAIIRKSRRPAGSV